MLKNNQQNESYLWDEKYKNSREYSSLDDYIQFSGNNPTILSLEKYIRDGSSILEIGSGTGELISYLKKKNNNIRAFGVDYSEVSIERSKSVSSKFNIEVDFSTGDIECLNFSDNTFDIVYGDQVIGHVLDVKSALKEIKRILKPGGYCLLSTSNKLRFDGWDLYKKISENHQGYTQRSFFPWELKSMLKASGFKYVHGYGDMIILFRNFFILKNKFLKSKEVIIKTRSKSAINKNNINASFLKKIYIYLDKYFPWWFKTSIGIVVKKS